MIDDSKYQKFISENIEPKLNFEYRAMKYENKTIAYFRIYNNENRPYLFKKDVINPVDNKVDFRYCDGFIRVGTSSEKIGRKELDNIERNKNRLIDRKTDLKISPLVDGPSDEDLSHLTIKYLDIAIFNASNKSIEFDAELKVYKGEAYGLITEFDLKKELQEKRRKVRKTPFDFSVNYSQLLIRNIHIDVSESEDSITLSRNAVKTKTSIILPQNSSERDVFHQNLLVLQDQANTIRGELTLRSDEFTEGPLILEVTFQT